MATSMQALHPSQISGVREVLHATHRFEGIIGHSAALTSVLTQLERVAPTDTTVLIQGETGTGKELLARALHHCSARRTHPFVTLNCAAIPDGLLESELFGHEKGAFTGALTPRMGRFELANTGTLFLDEIGDLPLALQPKLLRVLQEQEFERLGSSHTLRTDVRLVAATNRDLLAMVHQHMFREDLYYRVHVFPLTVPPLRERVDDIPVLVAYLIERYATKAGKKIRTITKQTVELLQTYDWPGNIRELQNVIERAVILCENDTFTVEERWLQRDAPQPAGPAMPLVAARAEHERALIEAALSACRGRVSGPAGAAAKLGLPRQTLESKIKALGIPLQRFKT
jgi:formate hydrogenlyase transcriptional activator